MRSDVVPFEVVLLLRDGKTTFQDWVEQRRLGLGGTDAAALCGHNPYKSVTTLFCEKVVTDVPAEQHADSEAAYFGRLLEPVVAEEFQRRTGIPTCPADCVLRSREWPWMQATLDFWVLDPTSGKDALSWEADSFLECKTTAWYRGKAWKAGVLPAYVEAQVLHYMAVTGFDHAWVACLIGGQSFFYQRVDRDETAIRRLVELERSFWEYVTAQELPPDPFVSPEDDPLGRVQFKRGETVSMLVLPDEVRDVIEHYWDLLGLEHNVRARRLEVEDLLGHAMYGANVGLVGSEKLLRWEGTRGNRRLVIARPGHTDQSYVPGER